MLHTLTYYFFLFLFKIITKLNLYPDRQLNAQTSNDFMHRLVLIQLIRAETQQAAWFRTHRHKHFVPGWNFTDNRSFHES